jgi:DNA-binding CsgD family transcriptional regulator
LTWSAVGRSADAIAGIMGITERTVRAHIGSAAHKLGTANKTATVAKALVLGLIAF